MIGAIAGDIIGSIYETQPIKTKDFPLFSPRCCFTDDTVLTVAVASAILGGTSYASQLLKYGRRYPNAGYGRSFIKWLRSEEPEPYGSWGNGAAMRVSPVGFAFETVEEVVSEAKKTAEVSHDDPEGIKGAQAVALAVFLARQWKDKRRLVREIKRVFGYQLGKTLDEIRPAYRFDISCQGTVPEAITAFAESDSWEDAVRNAISLGGDSDTLACIAGSIAEAYYGEVPVPIRTRVAELLPSDLASVTAEFCSKYGLVWQCHESPGRAGADCHSQIQASGKVGTMKRVQKTTGRIGGGGGNE